MAGAGVPKMWIAECRIRIEKEFNSEIPNLKSEILMADLAAQSAFRSEPSPGYDKIFDRLF